MNALIYVLTTANDTLVLNLNGESKSKDGDPSGSCRRGLGYFAFDHGDDA